VPGCRMPEPVQPIEPKDEASELETLRRVNAELLLRHAKDKSKISELEAGTSTLQTQLTEAGNAIKEITVNVPLRQIAERVSELPDTWMKLFGEGFKVEAGKDGKLSVMTGDGMPAKNSKGEPVAFDFVSIAHLVTEHEPESERTKLMKRLTRTNFASGAGSSSAPQVKQPPKQAIQFGLR